jgi:hypothetical protein
MPYRRRFAAAGLVSLAVAVACSPPKTAAPLPGVDPGLRAFLLDPIVDCDPAPDEPAAAEVRAAHRELVRTADAASALRSARLLEEQADGEPSTVRAAHVLRAQALLVGARPMEAVELLNPQATSAPACLPMALVLGRSQEALGELPEAFAAYSAAAGRSESAAGRADQISDRARAIVQNRFSAALEAGRREAAAWHLARLERFWPNSEEALVSAMKMAALQEDGRGELAAVKALLASRPEDSALALRRGQLELLVGDARTGLAIIEALAAADPSDPLLQTELARAKFSWRMLNSPEQVRSLREKVALSRADFAVLLYWTVPQIRTARPGAVQIASDIVDHPSRDEIARVANLGLMSIDESLHRFSPNAALRRSEAVSALLRLISADGRAGACGVPRAAGRDEICRAGAACGLIEDPALCQAGAGLSGSEAIEMLRRALDRSEGS